MRRAALGAVLGLGLILLALPAAATPVTPSEDPLGFSIFMLVGEAATYGLEITPIEPAKQIGPGMYELPKTSVSESEINHAGTLIFSSGKSELVLSKLTLLPEQGLASAWYGYSGPVTGEGDGPLFDLVDGDQPGVLLLVPTNRFANILGELFPGFSRDAFAKLTMVAPEPGTGLLLLGGLGGLLVAGRRKA